MDSFFAYASNLAGIPADQIKLLTCLVSAYPLASIYVRIPTSQTALRHLFSIAVSFFYLGPVLHLYSGLAQLLATSAFTYLTAYFYKSRNMPWLVFAVVMAHLTVNHILRAISKAGYETVEITGAQMVLAMKLTTFAWNVYDGRRKPEDLDASQLATRITTFPDPLEFFGYVFYFPGTLVGPSCEFVSYNNLVNGQLFAAPSSSGEKIVHSDGRVPNGRKRAAYTRLAWGAVFLGLYATAGSNMDYDRILEDWFPTKSIFYKIGFLHLLGLSQRTKYYGVWLLTEGSSILTGLGFNGYTASGATRWDRTANIDILNIELAPNFKVLLDSWNINTNIWLRNCVYKRVTPKGKKPGFASAMLTFLTSAFWHGIYIGYYMSFFFGGFIQYAARMARTYFRPFFLPPASASPNTPPTLGKRAYDAAGVLVSVILLNYAVAPFQLLDFKRSFLAWHRLGYHGHVIIAAAILFFNAGGKKFLRDLGAKQGLVIGAKKPRDTSKKVDGPVANGLSSGNVSLAGSPAPSVPGTPGLGQLGGYPLTVPPVDLGVREARKAL